MIGFAGGLLVATVDRRPSFSTYGHGERSGIAAFDPQTGAMVWSRDSVPPLGAVSEDGLYAYSRTGIVAAFDVEGRERWRSEVPDDRSPPARRRGDRDSPFVADVIARAGSVAVSAGPDVIVLEAARGEVLNRATISGKPRGVVTRLVQGLAGGYLCVCGERSSWDDESSQVEPRLWQPTPSPEDLRLGENEVVCLDRDLAERWRRSLPTNATVGNRCPVVGHADEVFLAGRFFGDDGSSRYLDKSRGWVMAIEGATGAVRWQREIPTGLGDHDPVAVSGGVVAGRRPALFEAGDGTIRWQYGGNLELDPRVAPLVRDGQLLLAGYGELVALDAADGLVRGSVAFAVRPFDGSIVTNLAERGGLVYLAVQKPTGAGDLVGVRVWVNK